MDTRYIKLAKNLCGHSAKIKQGEHVLLDLWETPGRNGGSPHRRNFVARGFRSRRTRQPAHSPQARDVVGRRQAGCRGGLLALQNEKDGRVHRNTRLAQHIRKLRRSAKQNGGNLRRNEGVGGLARQQDKVGCAALAEPRNGAACADEHRSFRKLLLRRLHNGTTTKWTRAWQR